MKTAPQSDWAQKTCLGLFKRLEIRIIRILASIRPNDDDDDDNNDL